MVLSTQASILWAKTGRMQQEEEHLWEPLYVHMADAAETARLLWSRWLPRAVKEFVVQSAGISIDDAERLIAWLAALHDIGKATPSFQWKNDNRAERVRECGLEVPKQPRNCPHALIGQIILQDLLLERGWDSDVAMTFTSIVGGHHGVTPNAPELNEIASMARIKPDQYFGGDAWIILREELFEYASKHCDFDSGDSLLADCPLTPSVQVLCTGLVIVADWIASNTAFFPLTADEELSWGDCRHRAYAAWEELELPEPLTLSSILPDDDVLFCSRFPGFSAGTMLRPAQRAAVEAARAMEEPGLLIIEAPMGNGKTEASLLCAEILAEKFGDGGLAYLLPTMATSNAMFSRVHRWLERLCRETDRSIQSLQLMHGKSELNIEFEGLKTWHPSSMGDDESQKESVVAHQWFSGKKRGLLSSFVVGTVDQLLMSALNAKHVHLRHLGLAGKVVIVDEVHAYDAYMNVYLDRALQFLGGYRVPVILLSATLPPDRREALIKAYRGQKANLAIAKAPRLCTDFPAYPLITSAGKDKRLDPHFTVCESIDGDVGVLVEFLPDDDTSLIEMLEVSLAGGGCACVIRDTVKRAQQTYEALVGKLDAPVKLVHSRFLAFDRAKNDQELLRLLGPNSDERPESLVVVGTQVIEQSLDIDFDLMVTDMAPIDLLLQRMGRLHRHNRGKGQSERPPLLRTARCVITGAQDWEEELPSFDRGISYVYSSVVLWQTLKVLRDYRCNGILRIKMPTDVATLVERTYSCLGESVDGAEHSGGQQFIEALNAWNEQIRSKENRAKDWLLPRIKAIGPLNGWMGTRLNMGESLVGRSAVRDTQESLEVVVVLDSENRLRLLPWVSEEYGVLGCFGDDETAPDSEIARIAALCTVELPFALTAPNQIEKVVSTLESQTPRGWRESHWLRGFLAIKVDQEGEGSIDLGERAFTIRYSKEKGLEVVERKEEKNG